MLLLAINSHFVRPETNFLRFQKLKEKKKKKKGGSSPLFRTFPTSISIFTFPLQILIFFSMLTPFQFFPCLFFSDTSGKISGSKVSGGALCPPPLPCLLRRCNWGRTSKKGMPHAPLLMLPLPFSREIPNTTWFELWLYSWQWNDNYWNQIENDTLKTSSQVERRKDKEINNPLKHWFPKIGTKLCKNWKLWKWFLIFSKSIK